MADEPEAPPTPEAEADQAPEPERREPPADNLVGEARRKQKQAEKEAAGLRERLEALEDKDKSETERERKAREKAEQRAAELDTKVKTLERGGWIRDAAKDFKHPEDVVKFLDLDALEDRSDAERAVKTLAKDRPGWLRDSESTPPQIGRVLENGQRVTTTPQKNPQAEQAEMIAGELKKFVRS